MKRSGVVALALALGIATASRAQDKKTIDVFIDDKDVPAAFAEIAAKAHAPILVDPALKGERLTISLQEIPWRDALEVCARMVRADVVWLKGGTPFVGATEGKTVALANVPVREAVAAVTTGTRLQAVVANDVQGNVTVDFKDLAPAAALSAIAHSCSAEAWDVDGVAVVSKRKLAGRSPIAPVARLPEVAEPEKLRPGPPVTITVDLKEAAVREACDAIGKRVGLNILVEPGYDERVTLAARNVPWFDVVAAIAASTGGEIETRGKVVVLTHRPRVWIQTYFASVGNLFRLLGAHAGKNVAVGPGGSVTAAPMRLSSVPWSVALRVAAIANGFELLEQGPDTVALAPTLDAGIVVDDPTPVRQSEPVAALEKPSEVEDEIDLALESIQAFPEQREAKIAELVKLARSRQHGFRSIRELLPRWAKRLGKTRTAIGEELDIAEAEDLLLAADQASWREDGSLQGTQHLVERAAELTNNPRVSPEIAVRRQKVAARVREYHVMLGRLAEAIERGRLVVEAIVIDPRPESKNRCVVGGRIYEVGDQVLDGAGRAVPGLRVVRIEDGFVMFHVEDIEFTRKAPW
jgi:hypothetical protein